MQISLTLYIVYTHIKVVQLRMSKWEKVPQYYEQYKLKQLQQSQYQSNKKILYKSQESSLSTINQKLSFLPILTLSMIPEQFTLSRCPQKYVQNQTQSQITNPELNNIFCLCEDRFSQQPLQTLKPQRQKIDKLTLKQESFGEHFIKTRENITSSQRLYYPSEKLFMQWAYINGKFPQKSSLCLPDTAQDEQYFANFQLKKINQTQ
ncbi:hypothetical protein SS50377_23448 [Spironucleus salmonicida]|uniref:Uncharacterized protein n=1 Tax=Spironucleus salmonicida TaxID=348837 RepID=V6LNL3_9EUKA|nr:hypothetical protein SS50377_23448 [Spironucleus salmonicida]|eukprot:EST46185.1 Hypothetical protein SS50377_13780 [Spironucleus salmonicida]